jgi:hypothetical protein
MKKKWIAINLLLLVTTIMLGRHLRHAVDDYKQKNNVDEIRLLRDDRPATAAERSLPPQAQPRIYNPTDFSVVMEKMVFSENRRSDQENAAEAAQLQKPEAPPLAQKPILVGTIISDKEKLAFIADPASAQRSAQPSGQDSIQGIAQAIRQGDIQGIVQAVQQGDIQEIAQAMRQGGMQDIAQAMGGPAGAMPMIAQALGGRDGMQQLAQAIGGRDGMQQLAQAFMGGGMQQAMQSARGGGQVFTGSQRSSRQTVQRSGLRVQVKRINDVYQGYTITQINTDNIVLESGSRKEIIPLYEGSKQPRPGKTAIKATQVVTLGQAAGTTTASAAQGAGYQQRPGGQPNAQQTPAARAASTQGTGTMPQRGATPQAQPGPPGPAGQNMMRTPFGDVAMPN